MATDYTPYDGLTITGWPDLVLVRGQLAVENGQLAATLPVGHSVPSGPIDPRLAPVAPRGQA
jgi:dihydropyrimidinase